MKELGIEQKNIRSNRSPKEKTGWLKTLPEKKAFYFLLLPLLHEGVYLGKNLPV